MVVMRWRCRQSSMCTAIILLVMFTKAHLLVAGTTTSGFPSLDTIHEAMTPSLRTFRNRDLWLFPNMVFNCSGNITKWIFRARNPDGVDGNSVLLPEFQVWRENVNTVNILDDYRVLPGVDVAEVAVIDGTVYEYVLRPPIEVQGGYILGVYAQESNRIFVEYLDMEEGNAPDSFYLTLSTRLSIVELGTGTLNQRFLPLVTAEISLGAEATTSVVFPDPTPSPLSELLPFPVISPTRPPQSTPTPAPSPTPPAVAGETPVINPVGSMVPSMPEESPTPPTDSDSGSVSNITVIGIVVGSLLVIIIVLVVLVILFALWRKKQTAIVLEQPQGEVIKSKETFATLRNDAYTTVIATERNKAYITNNDTIPASCNEAYGAVSTEVEGGDSLNKSREDMNDTVYTEIQGQTARDQGREELYSYVYVR